MSLRKTLLAATMLCLPLAAQAQPVNGLYVGAGVGGNYRHDATIPGSTVRPETLGWVGLGSICYGFGNGLRAELEGNFRQNDVSHFRSSGVNIPNSRGNLRTWGVMANALYDFQVGGPLTPYLGVGVGYGWNEWRRAGFAVSTPAAAASLRINDTDGSLAYQAIAGVAYNMYDMVPGMSLTAEYRFFGTLDPSLATTASARIGATTVSGSGTAKAGNNYNHAVLLGLRYAFGVAPAAPVVQPPQPGGVARTYLVFFDWNRADLTDRARQIIAQAADAARAAPTRLEVSGHADRSGTPQYNQVLSRRRAEAVAAELVRRGIARTEISIQAFGESRPLVPTADGVREPQNRRVEIVLK